MEKTKKEKNFKTLKGDSKRVEKLFFQHRKPVIPKGLSRLRAKGKQGIEGLFFNGLRSEYITREVLNEARKNEDINKIIDLGRVFLQKKEPWRSLRRLAVCTNKSPICKRKVSEHYNENSEQRFLSPTSLAFTLEESSTCIEDSNSKKFDLENELAMFCSKYEETVGVHLLHKLPESGILEDAIEAIRKMKKIGLNDPEPEEFGGNETELVKESKFFKSDFESEKPADENFIKDFVSPEKFLIPESHYNCENFGEKPWKNMLIMSNEESNAYNLPTFMSVMDNDDENDSLDVLRVQEKHFKKPTKDLNITSPPFQFYRRNMF